MTLNPELKAARLGGASAPIFAALRHLASGKAATTWAAVIAVGAGLAFEAARKDHRAPAPVESAAAAAETPAVASAPAPAPAPAAEAPKGDLAALVADPAPAAAPAKSTARVDMTPTGSIAADPAKPKHKHKKKPADLDKHN